MLDDSLGRIRLPKPWSEFLAEVDWQLTDTVHLHCVGGFTATVVYGIPRHTGDLDYIHVVPRQAAQELEHVGGPGSALAKKHKVFIHSAGVVELPYEYENRLRELDLGLTRLHIWIAEIYDLILSKLTRNSPKDMEDVKFLAGRHQLDFAVLYERWSSDMKIWVTNAERHENTLNLVWKSYFDP